MTGGVLYIHATVAIPIDGEPDDTKIHEAELRASNALYDAFPVNEFVEVDSELE